MATAFGEQVIATLRDHHRVEHHMGGLEVGQTVGHGAHDVRRTQHAELDRIDAHILEQGVDLALEEVHRRVCTPLTARVFCAVRAAITAQP